MPWTFSEDVEPYAERVLPLLGASPAEHTVGLSVIDTVRGGHAWSEEPMLFGWLEDDDGVRGAISHNPPYDVLLPVVPEAETAGVNGAIETVERFAATWTAGTALHASTVLEMRLFALGLLQPPEPPPAGRARAGAVTAACAADALARDVDRVVLFTDLAAPAPNAVYQRIGFRPLSDHRVIRFDDTG